MWQRILATDVHDMAEVHHLLNNLPGTERDALSLSTSSAAGDDASSEQSAHEQLERNFVKQDSSPQFPLERIIQLTCMWSANRWTCTTLTTFHSITVYFSVFECKESVISFVRNRRLASDRWTVRTSAARTCVGGGAGRAPLSASLCEHSHTLHTFSVRLLACTPIQSTLDSRASVSLFCALLEKHTLLLNACYCTDSLCSHLLYSSPCSLCYSHITCSLECLKGKRVLNRVEISDIHYLTAADFIWLGIGFMITDLFYEIWIHSMYRYMCVYCVSNSIYHSRIASFLQAN